MFIFGIIIILLMSTIIMISAWFYLLKRDKNFLFLLVWPYIIYFLFILSIGIEKLDIHMNSQFFIGSLVFFGIYSLFFMMYLVLMTKESRTKNVV